MARKKEKVRVVAYARVSTQTQVNDGNSLENQRNYFQRELKKNSNYELVELSTNNKGIYADEGISGTKLKRPQFIKMLQDAGLELVVSAKTDKEMDVYEISGKPKFDLIFVKDTTRFARNVSVDRLLKLLLSNGVVVHFLDLDKRTDSNEDMTYIQIFLTFGEQESRAKSVKTKFGHAEAHRRGDIATGGKIYGYEYVKKDKKKPYETGLFVINEEEAKLIKRIFDLYTEEGLGDFRICKRLNEEGYKNRKGNQFTTNTVARILKNEKYTGVNDAGKWDYGEDIFHKKMIEVDYDNEDRVLARKATQRLKDDGIVDRIPQIISVEQFQKAQEIRKKHCDNNKIVKCVYNGKTVYSKKVVCGRCGANYISYARKHNKDGTTIRRYACMHRQRYDNEKIQQCYNPSITEEELNTFITSEHYYQYKVNAYDEVLGAIEGAVTILELAKDADAYNKVKELENEMIEHKSKKDKLLDLYLSNLYTKEQLDEHVKKINKKIDNVSNQIEKLSKNNNEIQEQIGFLLNLKKEAEEEQKQLLDSLKDGIPKNIDIRAQLRDIERITVAIDGTLSLQLKKEADFSRVAEYIDDMVKPYMSIVFPAK